MLVRIAGKVLYRIFAEARWVTNQVLEAFLHPLSVSYISTETGKVTGRRPAFRKKGTIEIDETGNGGSNWPVALSFGMAMTGITLKIWTQWLG